MTHIETIAIHAGHQPDPATGAVTPPIHLSTTYEREADGSYRAGLIYSRYDNPNRASLEQCLAELENGVSAAAFSSGSAATLAVLQSLEPGAHVIAPDDAYFGTAKLLRDVFGKTLEASFVDMSDLGAVEAAMRKNTKVVWVETPSNPLVRVSDIRAISALARAHGAATVVDNTWATPVLQRPLELGASLSMHSTTKYLGGHSDILGGALITREDDELWQRIRMIQGAGGIVPSPFECWLAMRGIRTLPWRMRGHCENAAKVAHFLQAHRGIEAVHWPGLASHHAHDIAMRQMSAGGGMLSMQVVGGAAETLAMTGRLKLITRATSLGGTESLIEHRHSVEGAGSRAPENLLRMSVGLEHADDIIADLEQALG